MTAQPCLQAEMASEADAFVCLPGGYGTLEEALEMVTWLQLGFHGKPVALLNISGYYDHLLSFFDHCVKEVRMRCWQRPCACCRILHYLLTAGARQSRGEQLAVFEPLEPDACRALCVLRAAA